MVLVKNLNFVNVSFYAKYTAKKCLVKFWLKNKPFETIETWVSRKATLTFFRGNTS